MTETETSEFQSLLTEIKTSLPGIRSLQDETTQLRQQLTETRRILATRSTLQAPRSHASVSAQREALTAFARDTLGLTTRAALTTNEIPLPTQFGGQIRELISEFGVVRRCMAHYPIGMGTCRPPRMGTRPAFGSIAMSAP